MIGGFTLAPTRPADLAVRLRLAEGDRLPDDWQAVVNRIANSIAARLAGRLRRGVEFTVTRDPVGS
jgi:hypothetical protein